MHCFLKNIVEGTWFSPPTLKNLNKGCLHPDTAFSEGFSVSVAEIKIHGFASSNLFSYSTYKINYLLNIFVLNNMFFI